jgi:glycosyltransferase involved in cell wall biosynthesis
VHPPGGSTIAIRAPEARATRVLHFASGDGWGGAERVLTLLVAGALASPEMRVEVLLSNEGALAAALRALGAPVTVIPESGFSRAAHARAVLRWLGERRFDALHVHRYKEILLALLSPARRRGRLVVTVHGLQPRAQLSLREGLLVWGALAAARLRGARFAAVSEELRGRLARVLGTRAVVRIPNPMPGATPSEAPDIRRSLGWPPERPLVAFVGRLEEVKGPDRLLEIAARGDPRVGFVLIGSGSLEGALRRRVEAEQLGDRVALLGAVTDARAFLPQVDALALPSRHEGMPMILLEAAAARIPVVAFDVGGVAEVLDGSAAARRIPPGDCAAFRRALDEMLGSRGRIADDLERWAAATARRYGLAATTAAYLRLYRGEPLEPPARSSQISRQ